MIDLTIKGVTRTLQWVYQQMSCNNHARKIELYTPEHWFSPKRDWFSPKRKLVASKYWFSPKTGFHQRLVFTKEWFSPDATGFLSKDNSLMGRILPTPVEGYTQAESSCSSAE